MALVAPSLMAASFASLGQALEMLKRAGAPRIHLDVADGHFMPEVTMGQPVVESLRKATDLPLEVHLLIERPERYAREFVKAGANRVGVHVEATHRLQEALAAIRASGAKAGAALNPETPWEMITEALPELDFVLVLATHEDDPVQGIPANALAKVRRAAAWRRERGLDFEVEVEGSIGVANAQALARAGADILIAGSAIFQQSGAEERFKELARLAAQGPETACV